jgi:putative ABC transport system permease protein
MGLPQNTNLYNILDKNENKVPVPQNGILISEHLANLLQVKTGDSVIIDSPLDRNFIDSTPRTVTIQGVVPQYIGLNAFMEIHALQDFIRQGEISTSMLIKIDPQELSALKSKYRDAAQVATLEPVQENAAKIRQMMDSYNFTTYFLAIIAGIAGFALIYNSSIISLSERKRELASLSVLGLTPREILRVIISEQWTLSIIGIIIGIPLSYALLAGMAQSLSTDMFSIPANLPASALLWSGVGTVIFVWIAQNRTYHRIKALPFVEILAVQE